jgi:beta-galactosidase GanA
MMETSPFIIGAQYYRPPNPPKTDWARDLGRMKAAGMNTTKLWACWSWMNPKPDAYDFADLDELIALACGHELGVVVNLILEDAPYWLEHSHPEARYHDAESRPVYLGAAMNTPGGGWPGLCFDNATVVEAAWLFLKTVVERYRSNPAIISWDVWNEPHLEPASYFPDRIFCYCDASIIRFQQWLQKRYGSLDSLNEAWGRRFSDWRQVQPPRLFEAVPDMLDWRTFWFDNVRQWLDDRVAVVRGARGAQSITTHVALSGFTGQLATHTIDEWALAGAVDGFGVSSFPTWLMADDPIEHLFNLDAARAAADGKPFWQTELQGGRGRRDGTRSTPHPHPDVVTLEMWNVLAAGAKGILFWQWRPELLGPESPGYGLCAADGEPTPRTTAVTTFAQLLARLPQSLLAGHPIHSGVGLLLSRRTALHAYATDRTMDIYRRSVLGAYRMFVDADIAIDLVHEDEIEQRGIPSHVRCLYCPMPTVMSDTLAVSLGEWVDTGGRLISEAEPGAYDERGWRRTAVPANSLHLTFGASSIDSDAINEEVKARLGESTFTAAWLREQLALTSAIPIATFEDGRCAISRNARGEGEAILIATCPSVAYGGNRDAGTRCAITSLVTADRSAAVLANAPEPKLMTRRHRLTDGRQATFILNWTNREQSFTAATDLELHMIEGRKSIVAGAILAVPPMAGAVAIR